MDKPSTMLGHIVSPRSTSFPNRCYGAILNKFLTVNSGSNGCLPPGQATFPDPGVAP